MFYQVALPVGRSKSISALSLPTNNAAGRDFLTTDQSFSEIFVERVKTVILRSEETLPMAVAIPQHETDPALVPYYEATDEAAEWRARDHLVERAYPVLRQVVLRWNMRARRDGRPFSADVDVEDLINTACFLLIEHLPVLKAARHEKIIYNFEGYVARLAENVCKGNLRNVQERPVASLEVDRGLLENIVDPQVRSDVRLEVQEYWQHYREIVWELPALKRKLFLLMHRVSDRYSIAKVFLDADVAKDYEIAEAADIPFGEFYTTLPNLAVVLL